MKVIEMTYQQMRNVDDNKMPNVYLATSIEDKLDYVYLKTNTWIPTTGKFRASTITRWGEIEGDIEEQTDLKEYLDQYIAEHGSGYDDTQVKADISNIYDILNNLNSEGEKDSERFIMIDSELANHRDRIVALELFDSEVKLVIDHVADIDSEIADLYAISNTKQDKLIAGTGIEIVDNVINAIGNTGLETDVAELQGKVAYLETESAKHVNRPFVANDVEIERKEIGLTDKVTIHVFDVDDNEISRLDSNKSISIPGDYVKTIDITDGKLTAKTRIGSIVAQTNYIKSVQDSDTIKFDNVNGVGEAHVLYDDDTIKLVNNKLTAVDAALPMGELTDIISANTTTSNKLMAESDVNDIYTKRYGKFMGAYEDINDAPTTAAENDYIFVTESSFTTDTLYRMYRFNGTAWVEETKLIGDKALTFKDGLELNATTGEVINTGVREAEAILTSENTFEITFDNNGTRSTRRIHPIYGVRSIVSDPDDPDLDPHKIKIVTDRSEHLDTSYIDLSYIAGAGISINPTTAVVSLKAPEQTTVGKYDLKSEILNVGATPTYTWEPEGLKVDKLPAGLSTGVYVYTAHVNADGTVTYQWEAK